MQFGSASEECHRPRFDFPRGLQPYEVQREARSFLVSRATNTNVGELIFGFRYLCQTVERCRLHCEAGLKPPSVSQGFNGDVPAKHEHVVQEQLKRCKRELLLELLRLGHLDDAFAKENTCSAQQYAALAAGPLPRALRFAESALRASPKNKMQQLVAVVAEAVAAAEKAVAAGGSILVKQEPISQLDDDDAAIARNNSVSSSGASAADNAVQQRGTDPPPSNEDVELILASLPTLVHTCLSLATGVGKSVVSQTSMLLAQALLPRCEQLLGEERVREQRKAEIEVESGAGELKRLADQLRGQCLLRGGGGAGENDKQPADDNGDSAGRLPAVNLEPDVPAMNVDHGVPFVKLEPATSSSSSGNSNGISSVQQESSSSQSSNFAAHPPVPVDSAAVVDAADKRHSAFNEAIEAVATRMEEQAAEFLQQLAALRDSAKKQQQSEVAPGPEFGVSTNRREYTEPAEEMIAATIADMNATLLLPLQEAVPATKLPRSTISHKVAKTIVEKTEEIAKMFDLLCRPKAPVLGLPAPPIPLVFSTRTHSQVKELMSSLREKFTEFAILSSNNDDEIGGDALPQPLPAGQLRALHVSGQKNLCVHPHYQNGTVLPGLPNFEDQTGAATLCFISCSKFERKKKGAGMTVDDELTPSRPAAGSKLPKLTVQQMLARDTRDSDPSDAPAPCELASNYAAKEYELSRNIWTYGFNALGGSSRRRTVPDIEDIVQSSNSIGTPCSAANELGSDRANGDGEDKVMHGCPKMVARSLTKYVDVIATVYNYTFGGGLASIELSNSSAALHVADEAHNLPSAMTMDTIFSLEQLKDLGQHFSWIITGKKPDGDTSAGVTVDGVVCRNVMNDDAGGDDDSSEGGGESAGSWTMPLSPSFTVADDLTFSVMIQALRRLFDGLATVCESDLVNEHAAAMAAAAERGRPASSVEVKLHNLGEFFTWLRRASQDEDGDVPRWNSPENRNDMHIPLIPDPALLATNPALWRKQCLLSSFFFQKAISFFRGFSQFSAMFDIFLLGQRRNWFMLEILDFMVQTLRIAADGPQTTQRAFSVFLAKASTRRDAPEAGKRGHFRELFRSQQKLRESWAIKIMLLEPRHRMRDIPGRHFLFMSGTFPCAELWSEMMGMKFTQHKANENGLQRSHRQVSEAERPPAIPPVRDQFAANVFPADLFFEPSNTISADTCLSKNFFHGGAIVDAKRQAVCRILTRLPSGDGDEVLIDSKVTRTALNLQGHLTNNNSNNPHAAAAALLPMPFMPTLARAVASIARKVSGGCLVFSPSKKLADVLFTVVEHLLRGVSNHKVLREPTGCTVAQFNSFMKDFESDVDAGINVTLFVVARGRLAEGVNLLQATCRSVCFVGVPVPDISAPEVRAMKQRFGELFETEETMQAVSQALGRALRSTTDWASVVLIDSRYSSEQKYWQRLPQWFRKACKRDGEKDLRKVLNDIDNLQREKGAAVRHYDGGDQLVPMPNTSYIEIKASAAEGTRVAQQGGGGGHLPPPPPPAAFARQQRPRANSPPHEHLQQRIGLQYPPMPPPPPPAPRGSDNIPTVLSANGSSSRTSFFSPPPPPSSTSRVLENSSSCSFGFSSDGALGGSSSTGTLILSSSDSLQQLQQQSSGSSSGSLMAASAAGTASRLTSTSSSRSSGRPTRTLFKDVLRKQQEQQQQRDQHHQDRELPPQSEQKTASEDKEEEAPVLEERRKQQQQEHQNVSSSSSNSSSGSSSSEEDDFLGGDTFFALEHGTQLFHDDDDDEEEEDDDDDDEDDDGGVICADSRHDDEQRGEESIFEVDGGGGGQEEEEDEDPLIIAADSNAVQLRDQIQQHMTQRIEPRLTQLTQQQTQQQDGGDDDENQQQQQQILLGTRFYDDLFLHGIREGEGDAFLTQVSEQVRHLQDESDDEQ